MKAITVHQPYAQQLIDGLKPVENRTWRTNYRGPLAIHASATDTRLKSSLYVPVTLGAVLGTVELVDCIHIDELNASHDEYHMYLASHHATTGPWCWIVEDPDAFAEPVPAKGKQGFWEWERPDQYIAYCYQEGDVRVGRSVPDGAIPLVAGCYVEVCEWMDEHLEVGVFGGQTRPVVRVVNELKEQPLKAVGALADWVLEMQANHQGSLVFGSRNIKG